MTLSFPQMFEYPHLAEFASLFSKATISAKNYSDYSINKFGISYIGYLLLYPV